MTTPQPPADFLPASTYDHEASVRWAGHIGARARQCWWNALRVLSASEGSIGIYVEGFVLAPYGMVLDHGWIETPEGRVIDPTFPTITANDPAEPYRYMPARRYTFAQVRDKQPGQFPLYNDGGNNFRLEREEPWASTRQAAYAARNRIVAEIATEASGASGV